MPVSQLFLKLLLIEQVIEQDLSDFQKINYPKLFVHFSGSTAVISVNLSLNACPTYALPFLIPPWKRGKKKSSSLPFTRGGLGWGDAVSNAK